MKEEGYTWDLGWVFWKRAELSKVTMSYSLGFLAVIVSALATKAPRVSCVAEPFPLHPPVPSPLPTVTVAANGQSQMCGHMGWVRSCWATFWMSFFFLQCGNI